MPEPGNVVVVGSINQDHVVVADRFPRPGETVSGTGVRTSIGGKGANQAVAAALAGAPVAFVGRVGADDAGATALDALSAAGVDVSQVDRRDDVPTGTAWITVAEQDNTIVVVPGANESWVPDWPDDTAAARLRNASVVLAQLEIPMPVVVAAAAATAGRFVLNAAPAAALPDDLLAHCDVLVVNEHELAVVAGPGDVTESHARLLARGIGAVVTTLGARGAVCTDRSGTHEIASPPARVVDTTGAGDAFIGVLCARLAGGAELNDAVHWAAVAGSIAVRSAGTHASYPDAKTLAAAV